MKALFTTPKLEIIQLESKDIISTSLIDYPEVSEPISSNGDINLPFDPF